MLSTACITHTVEEVASMAKSGSTLHFKKGKIIIIMTVLYLTDLSQYIILLVVIQKMKMKWEKIPGRIAHSWEEAAAIKHLLARGPGCRQRWRQEVVDISWNLIIWADDGPKDG